MYTNHGVVLSNLQFYLSFYGLNVKSKKITKSLFSFFFWTKYHFCWTTVQNRRYSKTMETTSRRVWPSKQTKFKWIQLIHSLPKPWTEQKILDSNNSINLAIQDHHLIKKHQILCLNKLNSKELYNIQILANSLKPASESFFENVFVEHVFEWNKIYILPRIVTTDFRIRIFQYKILHVLYLKKSHLNLTKWLSRMLFLQMRRPGSS